MAGELCGSNCGWCGRCGYDEDDRDDFHAEPPCDCVFGGPMCIDTVARYCERERPAETKEDK